MTVKRKDIQKLATKMKDFMKKLGSDIETAALRDSLNFSIFNLQRYFKFHNDQLKSVLKSSFSKSFTISSVFDKYSLKWFDLPNKNLPDDLPAIMKAVKMSDHYLVQTIILESEMTGEEVYKRDGLNRTALMYGVHYYNEGTFRLLVEHCADVNEATHDGRTATHIACMEDNVEALQILHANNADVTLVDDLGRRAIHWAAISKGTKCLQYLLSLDVSVSKMNMKMHDNDGMTAMMWAACKDKVKHLKLLNKFDLSLEKGQSNDEEDDVDDYGRRWIHWCVQGNTSIRCLKEFLSEDYLNATDNLGKSLIHMAAENGSVDALKFIASFERRLKTGLVASSDRHDNKRISEDTNDDEGEEEEEEDEDNDENNENETESANNENNGCIDNDGDNSDDDNMIDRRDALDRTPLILASMAGHADAVNYLLSRKADLMKVDRFGASAWDYARTNQLHYCMLIIASYLKQSNNQSPNFFINQSINQSLSSARLLTSPSVEERTARDTKVERRSLFRNSKTSHESNRDNDVNNAEELKSSKTAHPSASASTLVKRFTGATPRERTERTKSTLNNHPQEHLSQQHPLQQHPTTSLNPRPPPAHGTSPEKFIRRIRSISASIKGEYRQIDASNTGPATEIKQPKPPLKASSREKTRDRGGDATAVQGSSATDKKHISRQTVLAHSSSDDTDIVSSDDGGDDINDLYFNNSNFSEETKKKNKKNKNRKAHKKINKIRRKSKPTLQLNKLKPQPFLQQQNQLEQQQQQIIQHQTTDTDVPKGEDATGMESARRTEHENHDNNLTAPDNRNVSMENKNESDGAAEKREENVQVTQNVNADLNNDDAGAKNDKVDMLNVVSKNNYVKWDVRFSFDENDDKQDKEITLNENTRDEFVGDIAEDNVSTSKDTTEVNDRSASFTNDDNQDERDSGEVIERQHSKNKKSVNKKPRRLKPQQQQQLQRQNEKLQRQLNVSPPSPMSRPKTPSMTKGHVLERGHGQHNDDDHDDEAFRSIDNSIDDLHDDVTTNNVNSKFSDEELTPRPLLHRNQPTPTPRSRFLSQNQSQHLHQSNPDRNHQLFSHEQQTFSPSPRNHLPKSLMQNTNDMKDRTTTIKSSSGGPSATKAKFQSRFPQF